MIGAVFAAPIHLGRAAVVANTDTGMDDE